MNPVQQAEIHRAIDPVEVNNGGFTSRVIDVAEAAYVEYHVHISDADIGLTELKVQESDTKTNDTTLGGSPSDVLDWSASGTDPDSSDADAVFVIGIDMTRTGPRSRYQQLVATAGNGADGVHLAAVAVVSRSGERSELPADRGDVKEAQYL